MQILAQFLSQACNTRQTA